MLVQRTQHALVLTAGYPVATVIVSPVTQQSRQALDPRAEVLSASLLLQTHNKNQLHNHLSEWTFWQGLVRTK